MNRMPFEVSALFNIQDKALARRLAVEPTPLMDAIQKEDQFAAFVVNRQSGSEKRVYRVEGE